MNRAVSMRRRLIARLLAGALLLTLTSALGLYFYLRGELIEEYDGAIVAKARALAEILSEEHEHFFGQSAIERPRSVPRLTLHRGDYYQIWSIGGAVAGRSASLEGYDLPRIGRMRPGRPVSVVYEVSLPGGRRGRAVEALVDPGTAADYAAAEAGQTSVLPPSLVIATDVEEMTETLRHLAWALLAMALGVTLGTTALVVLVVSDGMQAVRRLSADVARVDADTLRARIDAASLPRELQPIARGLNGLLDRLDAVLSRERRFTANVAHELRTPLAELRAMTEVALRWPPDGLDGHAATYSQQLQVIEKMSSLVAALFALVRLQAGSQSIELAECSLADAVEEAWRSHVDHAEQRGLAFEADLDPEAVVGADPVILAALLGNLLGNAVRHAPDHTRIECMVRTHGRRGGPALLLSNAAPDLAPGDVAHLDEPFWQKDASRSDAAGAGIGLALVRQYAAALAVECHFSLEHQRLSVELSWSAGAPVASVA